MRVEIKLCPWQIVVPVRLSEVSLFLLSRGSQKCSGVALITFLLWLLTWGGLQKAQGS